MSNCISSVTCDACDILPLTYNRPRVTCDRVILPMCHSNGRGCRSGAWSSRAASRRCSAGLSGSPVGRNGDRAADLRLQPACIPLQHFPSLGGPTEYRSSPAARPTETRPRQPETRPGEPEARDMSAEPRRRYWRHARRVTGKLKAMRKPPRGQSLT